LSYGRIREQQLTFAPSKVKSFLACLETAAFSVSSNPFWRTRLSPTLTNSKDGGCNEPPSDEPDCPTIPLVTSQLTSR